MTSLRFMEVPQLIHIEVTSACRLKCPQCYNSTSSKEIEMDLLMSYLEEAARLGVKCIALSGGEPLLYPFIEIAINKIHKLGMSPTMATSGDGLSIGKIKDLNEAGLKDIWISLNGSSKEIHEKSRDGYEITLRAAKLLMESNIEIRVNWVAKKENIADFPDFIKLCKELKVKRVNVLRLKPDSVNEITSTPERADINQLANYIRLYNDKSIKIDVEHCFSILRKELNGNKWKGFNAGCPAGRGLMAINVDGELLPCRHLFHGEKHSTISTYWQESKVLKMLRSTEENVEKPCQDCLDLPYCRTCRALCEKLYGSFYAGEKDCAAFKGDMINDIKSI